MLKRDIYSLGFVLADSKSKRHIGNVTVSKWGEPSLTPNILKVLKDDEIVALCRDAVKSFSILKAIPASDAGEISYQICFYFSIEKKKDCYEVFKNTLQGKSRIGQIKLNNGRLAFENDVPEYMRKFCIAELCDMTALPEFTYQNIHYNKK